MKRLLVLSVILLIFLLPGCGLYNLNGFVLPDDAEFLALIEELDTPEKICRYMVDSFEYEAHLFVTLTPYQLYLTKKGDCDDLSTFSVYFANYHNYETYQIQIYFENSIFFHTIAIYKENNKYNYSSNGIYFPIKASSFKEIVIDSTTDYYYYMHYKVYDYDNNLIEQVTND